MPESSLAPDRRADYHRADKDKADNDKEDKKRKAKINIEIWLKPPMT